MPSIAEILREATEILRSSGISEPRREAASLLALALGKNQTFLIAHSEYEPSAEEENRFREFLARRARREPFQHIAGRQEFYGLDFRLTPDVLIPRPETELVVEHAIEILGGKKNASICEVGVGSGCIAVSILHSLETATATGLDISERALRIARLNAEQNKVADRIKLRVTDVFAALQSEKFDLIVSNPPYIPPEDLKTLQAEVRDFEPAIALTDGKDGFSIIEKIVKESPRFLIPGAFLLMEIGFNQSATVSKMFSPDVWATVEVLPDLQGIPRMVKARASDS